MTGHREVVHAHSRGWPQHHAHTGSINCIRGVINDNNKETKGTDLGEISGEGCRKDWREDLADGCDQGALCTCVKLPTNETYYLDYIGNSW